MVATCTHGFAPGTCLICQTLEAGASSGGASGRAAGRPRPAKATARAPRPTRRERRVGDLEPTPATLAATGPRVIPPTIGRSRFPVGVWVIAALMAAVAIVVMAWTLLHVVFAVLHILELIGAALLAGYLGWVAGVHHGRRQARREDGHRR